MLDLDSLFTVINLPYFSRKTLCYRYLPPAQQTQSWTKDSKDLKRGYSKFKKNWLGKEQGFAMHEDKYNFDKINIFTGPKSAREGYQRRPKLRYLLSPKRAK